MSAPMTRERFIPAIPLAIYVAICFIWRQTSYYDPQTFHWYALLGFGPAALLTVGLGTRKYGEPIRTLCFLITALILAILAATEAKAAGGPTTGRVEAHMNQERDHGLYVFLNGHQWMYDEQGRLTGVDLGTDIVTYRYANKTDEWPAMVRHNDGEWLVMPARGSFGGLFDGGLFRTPQPPGEDSHSKLCLSLLTNQKSVHAKDDCTVLINDAMAGNVYGWTDGGITNYLEQQPPTSSCNRLLDEMRDYMLVACGALAGEGWGAVVACQVYQLQVIERVRRWRCGG